MTKVFGTNFKVKFNCCRYSRGKEGHTQDFGPALASEGFFGVGNHPQHEDTSYRKSLWGKGRLKEVLRWV